MKKMLGKIGSAVICDKNEKMHYLETIIKPP